MLPMRCGVCRMLIATQRTVGLKRYTVEDATFGYWLQPWDLRHINQTRFRWGGKMLENETVM